MKIVLTAGGSGGHITPILAIATEIKKINPKSELIYIGQKGDIFTSVTNIEENVDKIYKVRAGKFRRYPSDGLKQFLDVSTFLKNFRDFFFVIIGIFQSYFILRKIKPDIVFSRGGYVSVPVCLGAKLNKIPYITHDSDSIASLANRIIAPWALRHFVSMPVETYKYPKDKTINTGIPLNSSFIKITPQIKKEYRKRLNILEHKKVLMLIGGGQGARDLNNLFIKSSRKLFEAIPDLYVIHIVGKLNYESAKKEYSKVLSHNDLKNVNIIDYTNEVYLYSGSSDLIITRAGATNLAEFAIQAKPSIVIPSSYLASGHQIENAYLLARSGAVELIIDKDLNENNDLLYQKILELISSKDKLQELSDNFYKFAKPGSAHNIANLIIELASNRN